MYAENYSEGRECSICGHPITDDNPDGIGCTCRDVWNRAQNSAFFHFCGLDLWIAKANFWAELYVETCKNVKFRSAFRKSFFESINKMVDEKNVRLSAKMLKIITDYLIGDDLDLVYNNAHPKLSGEQCIATKGKEQAIKDTLKNKWLSKLTSEQNDYINNMAKKYYNESRNAAKNNNN